jgi:hypothetical protein
LLVHLNFETHQQKTRASKNFAGTRQKTPTPWQQLCNNQNEIVEAKRHSSSQREVAAQQLNWQQLCIDRGGSNNNNVNNNGDDNDDDNDAEKTTMITTTMAAGTIRINAKMDMAAALRKGLTMPGKCR